MDLLVKKVRENATIMKKATKGSAGMDLCACIDKPLVLRPKQRATIPTGIAIAFESEEYAAFIFARSGLAIKHGITLSNAVGVVDSDYRGEVCVGLINLSDTPYEITPGERIAQMILMPCACVDIIEAEVLPQTQRGEGGFGSTGKL